MPLCDSPLEDIYAELARRGYVIRSVGMSPAGDLAALPRVTLYAASVAELIQTASAHGVQISDVREPLAPVGVQP